MPKWLFSPLKLYSIFFFIHSWKKHNNFLFIKLIFKQVDFFCLYRVSLKSIFFFKVQTKGWIGVLVLPKNQFQPYVYSLFANHNVNRVCVTILFILNKLFHSSFYFVGRRRPSSACKWARAKRLVPWVSERFKGWYQYLFHSCIIKKYIITRNRFDLGLGFSKHIIITCWDIEVYFLLNDL